MNRLANAVLAGLVLSTFAASAAVAQVRTESATSPFTYEALGATPRIRLFEPAPDAHATAGAKSSDMTPVARSRNEPLRTPVLTYEALGATPSVTLKKPAADAAAARR
jgi:hypothetical protein